MGSLQKWVERTLWMAAHPITKPANKNRSRLLLQLLFFKICLSGGVGSFNKFWKAPLAALDSFNSVFPGTKWVVDGPFAKERMEANKKAYTMQPILGKNPCVRSLQRALPAWEKQGSLCHKERARIFAEKGRLEDIRVVFIRVGKPCSFPTFGICLALPRNNIFSNALRCYSIEFI